MASDRFEFKRSLLVLGNLAVLAWSILAIFAVWLICSLVTWFFFITALAIAVFSLRRLGCTTCAYCRTCTVGFGRISGWFFGDRNVKDVRNRTALVFVAVVYGLSGFVPVALLTSSVIWELVVFQIALLACTLVFLLYSLATWLRS